MLNLTKEEKESYNVESCKPETYLAIISDIAYYRTHPQGHTEITNALLSLKTQMEEKCNMTNIHRSLGMKNHSHIYTPKTKKFTMENFEVFELDSNGKRSLHIPEEKTEEIPDSTPEAILALRALTSTNYEEERRKQLFPEICSEECKFVTCPYRTFENYGKPCQMRWEQYRSKPSQFETRSLDPNIPDYHSPLIRNEKKEKPKEPFKESLLM